MFRRGKKKEGSRPPLRSLDSHLGGQRRPCLSLSMVLKRGSALVVGVQIPAQASWCQDLGLIISPAPNLVLLSVRWGFSWLSARAVGDMHSTNRSQGAGVWWVLGKILPPLFREATRSLAPWSELPTWTSISRCLFVSGLALVFPPKILESLRIYITGSRAWTAAFLRSSPGEPSCSLNGRNCVL